MRTKALLAAAFALLVVLAAGYNSAGDTLPAGAEGCVVDGQDLSGPTGPLTHKTSCTYTSTRTGGYAARGNWTMSVTVGSTTTTYTPANAPPMGCSLWGPGTIVSVGISDATSVIAAGNPYPSASDAVVPSRPCAT